MKKFEEILDTVMRFIMAAAMFALLAGGTWQITSRWVLKNPSTFTDEFLRYVLIWASMLGSAYCFYKDEHLALDLVKDRVRAVSGRPCWCSLRRRSCSLCVMYLFSEALSW